MPSEAELESLVTRFLGDNKDLLSKIRESETALGKYGGVVDSTARRVGTAFDRMGSSAVSSFGAIVGVVGATSAVFKSVQLASEAELLSASFEVLLGSAQQAQKTLGDLRTFALETPFQLPEIVESAKQMVAFGEEADSLVPTMRLLGEVSGGLQIPLKELAYLYGTLRAQGRAYTVDIRQFAMRGIPIYLELAKALGLVAANAKRLDRETYQRLDKMIEQGAVDFTMVEKAFQRMTGPGGQFFGQLEKQSKTVIGLFNAMREEVDTALKTIGNTLIEGLNLKEVIRQVSALAQGVNQFLEGLSPRVRGVMLAVAGLLGLTIALAVAWKVVAAAVTFAFGGLNLVLAAGIAAVVGGIAVWVESVGGLEKAWYKVKGAAEDFWKFVEPMLPALAAGLLIATGPLAPMLVMVGLLIRNWEEVAAVVSRFWNEAQPVLRAFRSLMAEVGYTVRERVIDGIAAAVKIIKELAFWVRAAAVGLNEWWRDLDGTSKGVLAALGGGLTVLVALNDKFVKTFGNFRDHMVDMLLFTEFLWTKFSDLAALAITSVLYGFGKFSEDVQHFFKSTVPTALVWFLDSWEKMFTAAFNIGKAFVDNLVAMIVLGIASVPDIIEGKFDLAGALGQQMKLFRGQVAREVAKVEAPKFPAREETKRERDLLTQLIFPVLSIEEQWQLFREGKLLKFWQEKVRDAAFAVGEILGNVGQDAEAKMGQAGAAAGDAFSNEFGKHLRFDSVLATSAEAMSRIAEYRDSFPSDLPRRFPTVPRVPLSQAPMPREIIRPVMVEFGEAIRNVTVPALPPAPPPREVGREPLDIMPREVKVGQAPPPNRAEEDAVTLLTQLLAVSQQIRDQPHVVLTGAGIG